MKVLVQNLFTQCWSNRRPSLHAAHKLVAYSRLITSRQLRLGRYAGAGGKQGVVVRGVIIPGPQPRRPADCES
jgi:hypothetical protein